MVGYTLEVAFYDHTLKEFELIPFTDERGQVTPARKRPASEFALKIYDMLGREVYNGQGTLNRINSLLRSTGTHWPSGTYIIELNSKADGLMYRQKLVKH